MGNFIERLNDKHLCTFFILPLLGLNSESFGGEVNFINSYLINECPAIAVHVADASLCFEIEENVNFTSITTRSNGDFIVLDIPDHWIDDYNFFVGGMYSKMSDAAKFTIRELSGLGYKNLNERGEVITDARLMALDLDPNLKRKWAEELGVSSTEYIRPNLDLSGELLSKPSIKGFIKLNDLL